MDSWLVALHGAGSIAYEGVKGLYTRADLKYHCSWKWSGNAHEIQHSYLIFTFVLHKVYLRGTQPRDKVSLCNPDLAELASGSIRESDELLDDAWNFLN